MLRELPERDRAKIRALLKDGLSPEEISDWHEYPLEQVRKIQRRIDRFLRNNLFSVDENTSPPRRVEPSLIRLANSQNFLNETGGEETNNIQRIIARLNSEKNGYSTIIHKLGWFGYLDDGDTVFTPEDLKTTIVQVLSENPPRGKRLFDLNWRKEGNPLHFTMLPSRRPKTGPSVQPKRIEEALERFIVLSNGDHFYNQIPIGGGKESLDIGIKDSDSKFIFVELKPWNTKDLPLYALIESLKNLVAYRTILERRIAKIQEFEHIELMILAPVDYYQTYRMLKSDETRPENRLSVLRNTLTKIKGGFKEFNLAAISFMSLPEIGEAEFLQKCWEVYRGQFNGKTKELVYLTEVHAIPLLARDRWKLVVSDGEMD